MFDKINVEYISGNFIKGDNTYGLTLRGEKRKIEKFIANEEFSNYNLKVNKIDANYLEVKFLDKYGQSVFVPIEIANKILINFPSFKYTTFWEKNGFNGPELYIIYSESGTNDITDFKYVTLLSREDEYNPLTKTDITDPKIKKFEYQIGDSRYGFEDETLVEYGYPFYEQLNSLNYKEVTDNENIFIEESKDKLKKLLDESKDELIQKIKNADLKFLNSNEFKSINDNEKYMLIFLESNPNWGNLISDRLKDDENFIYKYLEENHDNNLEFMSERLKTDIDFVLKLLKINKQIYYYLPKSIRENTKIKEATMINLKDLFSLRQNPK